MFVIVLYMLFFRILYVNAQECCVMPQWKGCEQVIIDTDGGGDDGTVIIKLLYAYEKLIGPLVRAITIVNGIANVTQAAINVGKILEYAGRTDIPIYIGATEPLVPPTMPAEPVYGIDAFGDLPYNGTIPPPTPGIAAKMLVSLLNEIGDNTVLLALGPMTNIALAYKTDKNFFKKLKRMDIIAGSVNGSGEFNVPPGREFSAYHDPYAFKVVLENTNYKQANLYPYDLIAGYVVERDFWGNLPATQNNYVNFARTIVRVYISNHPTLFFLSATAGSSSIIYPQAYTRSEPLRVSIVTSNEARGVLLVDYANKHIKPETSNLNVVQHLDMEIYKQYNLELANC